MLFADSFTSATFCREPDKSIVVIVVHLGRHTICVSALNLLIESIVDIAACPVSPEWRSSGAATSPTSSLLHDDHVMSDYRVLLYPTPMGIRTPHIDGSSELNIYGIDTEVSGASNRSTRVTCSIGIPANHKKK